MKFEFLALKWAMTEKFREYLLRYKCVVFMDNNPLSHLVSAKLGSQNSARLPSLLFLTSKFGIGQERVIVTPMPFRDSLQLIVMWQSSCYRPLWSGSRSGAGVSGNPSSALRFSRAIGRVLFFWWRKCFPSLDEC